MNNFKLLDSENLIPIYINLIDLFKTKTFIWLQYLHNDKKLIFEFYDKNEFYFDCEKWNIIEFDKLYINNNFNNYIILFLKYDSYTFIYKIILDDIININKEEIFNIDNFNINNNFFIYKDIINFNSKLKNENITQYKKERICVNIKILFNGEIKYNKISLITEEKYEEIVINSSSDYTNEELIKKNIDISDITFFFFYIPNYINLNDIFGFIYYSSSKLNLTDLNYRFFYYSNETESINEVLV